MTTKTMNKQEMKMRRINKKLVLIKVKLPTRFLRATSTIANEKSASNRKQADLKMNKKQDENFNKMQWGLHTR
jgi:hypothetical protein